MINWDWAEVLATEDVNKAWDEYLEVIETKLNKMCPLKDISTHNEKADWITIEHLEQIKLKDDLMLKARQTRNRDDWINAQKSRNMTKAMMKRAKSTYLVNALTENREDSKKLWRTLHKILPNNKSERHPINLIDHDGNQTDPKNAATLINDFFTTVAGKLDVHTDKWTDPGRRTESKFQVTNLDMKELKEELRKININKSSGIDHISSRVIKEAFLATPHVLLHIMKLSIAFSVFPDRWKSATIVPIEKKPNAPTPSELRPISLLPLPGKILERLVSNRMMRYLEKNELLSKGQDGFRKGRSTTKAVSTLTDEILTEAGKGNLTTAVFIDFSKAFDCVNHKILLNKLGNLGFLGSAVDWFGSYLTGRRQRTLANGVLSEYREIACGVPQGSILGPALFILFVNDMPETIQSAKISQYADDTVIYASGSNEIDIAVNLNLDLGRLTKWCRENKLHVNCNKTKYLTFGPQGKTSACIGVNLEIGGTRLKRVNTYKYLGITLDQNHTYGTHLATLARTVRHKVYLLRTVRPHLTVYAALT